MPDVSGGPPQFVGDTAIEPPQRHCVVVLHDDRLSQKDILCGTDVLHTGELGFLSASGAKTLCISPAGIAASSNEVSIHVSLAERFGFENRHVATLSPVTDLKAATATHVELLFRDHCLSRADMWHIMAGVDETVLYRGQIINYLGTPTAEVQRIYIAGKEIESAFASHPQTKPIFRSGSARYTILVEISAEMLEIWADGKTMYEKLINGFLAELLKRWNAMKARHLVSIILFGRLVDKNAKTSNEQNLTLGGTDFFNVIATETSSVHSNQLLRKLKHALNTLELPGSASLAANSNMLEAIHLAATDFVDDQTDVRLTTTGNSIIAATAGTGLFRATRNLLNRTTDLLIGNSIGVDVVALSPKPLHPSPLFKYLRNGDVEYALPHWIDVSFWDESQTQLSSQALPQAEMPLNDVSIPLLKNDHPEDTDTSFVELYDDHTFGFDLSGIKRTSKPTTIAIDKGSGRSVEPIKDSGFSKDSFVKKTETTSPLLAKAPVSRPSSVVDGELNERVKRPALSQHPLLHSGRKISLGPKGLAPSRGVASTTLSSAYAQHGKDVASSSSTNTHESSSGLAKAIRASLARKSSQQSLVSRRTGDNDTNQTTQPIDILAGLETTGLEPKEPMRADEKRATDPMVAVAFENDTPLSITPKAEAELEDHPPADTHIEITEGLSPWVTLLNPCNPRRDNMRIASQYRQWQHIFPRAVNSAEFKWASLCSTAALPATVEFRPSMTELENRYTKKVRRHVISHSLRLRDESASSLFDKLIDVRLIRGFQIAAIGYNRNDKRSLTEDLPILLALGKRYHEIRQVSELEIQITQFEPEGTRESNESHLVSQIPYKPNIRTLTGLNLEATVADDLRSPLLDWSPLDDYILGFAPSHDTKSFFKLRLVLIPVDLSRADPSAHSRLRELSDEERRIEGIQRLTQIWQRQRFFSAEDQQHQVSLAKRNVGSNQPERDPNPLAIEYQTRDPSVVVNAHGPLLTSQLDNGEPVGPLFTESDKHHSSNFDATKLVKQMQEPPPYGVEMRDRRWLTQTHLKCFRGDEMTSWLLGVFKDLQLREDAVEVGNELMKRGIFTHVRQKHNFRDGHYFYQITGAYRSTDYPNSTGLFSKVPWRSIPATPSAETVASPLVRPLSNDSSSSGKGTPIVAANQKQVLLSQVLQYNVDPAKRTKNLQIIDLHYGLFSADDIRDRAFANRSTDQIHNPENCYHIQLEWLTASSKLIRESINRWSALVESYGLKLVHLPMQEAYKFRECHPFDQPQPLKLALRSADIGSATSQTGQNEPLPQLTDDRIGPCQFVLRKSGFVLDYEAASAFTDKLNVSFSWGSPNYTYTQFIHRSGLVIAQVLGEQAADIILLPNPLATSRIPNPTKQTEAETAESIMNSFRTFCHDEEALGELLKEFTGPRGSASPFSPAVLDEDHDVPPLNLTNRGHGRRNGS